MSNWQAQAACTSQPDLFFPLGDSDGFQDQVIEAAKVCLGCPVRTECLTWAMKHHPQAGIWSGTTEKQRAEMRKRARREGADRLVSARIAQRRKQVAWLSSRGLQPHQIASRMGETVSVVSKDLKRLKDAA